MLFNCCFYHKFNTIFCAKYIYNYFMCIFLKVMYIFIICCEFVSVFLFILHLFCSPESDEHDNKGFVADTFVLWLKLNSDLLKRSFLYCDKLTQKGYIIIFKYLTKIARKLHLICPQVQSFQINCPKNNIRLNTTIFCLSEKNLQNIWALLG